MLSSFNLFTRKPNIIQMHKPVFDAKITDLEKKVSYINNY